MISTKMHPPNKEYRAAPPSYNDFVFVDLNLGIPQPDPGWLRSHLKEIGAECEMPECHKVASSMLVVDQFTPLLCDNHAEWVAAPESKLRTFAKRIIKNHMKDEFFEAEYGSRSRAPDQAPKAITVQFIPYDQRNEQRGAPAPVKRLNLPKLGQVGA